MLRGTYLIRNDAELGETVCSFEMTELQIMKTH